MVQEQVALALGAAGVVVGGSVLAKVLRAPVPVVLVLAGLAYALLPGRNIELDPELVLTVVIPPLLYSAAIDASLVDIRASRRPIAALSVGLVLATAFAVGAVLTLLLPQVPFAVAFALGAAVAPPDPVASLGVARRAGLPPRLTTLVEGEGLLNDATALTAYQVAVAAATGAGFSMLTASGRFFLAAAGGIVVGLAVAYVVRLLLPRLDPLLGNVVSLSTPFGAYLAAEQVHASGVLAVVVAGLWIAHSSPAIIPAATRLQSLASWRLIALLLEGLVFLLIGQQVPQVLGGLDDAPIGRTAAVCAAVVGVVLLVRPLWLVVLGRLPGGLLGDAEDLPLARREVAALSWAGTRGVITLAAAFALPADVPNRELLLLCAYLVVLFTLVGQGLTLGPLLRLLGVQENGEEGQRAQGEAGVAAAQAALRRLDEIEDADEYDHEIAERARRDADRRLRRRSERLESLDRHGADAEEHVRPVNDAADLRRELLEAERQELLRRRDGGELRDADLRSLQRELDHEERLPPS